MVDINVLKNGFVAENFESCISFCQKMMYSRWDNINIDRHSRSRTGFIVNTIRYDRHYATKISFPNMLITDYLGA